MTEPTIRAAASADLPILREMQGRSLRQLGCRHYTAAQIDAFIARIGTMDDYLVSDRTYLVAELDGAIVGCGGWTTRLPGYARGAGCDAHAPDPDRATVRSVFVEPAIARQGIGRRIMAAVEGTLVTAGFRSAELGATQNGRDFYRSQGYRPVASFEVELGDGIRMGFTRMRKPLASANQDRPGPQSLSA